MCVVCEGKMNGSGLKKLTVRLVCVSFCAFTFGFFGLLALLVNMKQERGDNARRL